MSVTKDQYLTVQDVATQLRLDYQKVKAWCDSGTLPCVDLKSLDPTRKNHCYRIRQSELDAWIEKSRIQKPEPRRKSRKKGRYSDV